MLLSFVVVFSIISYAFPSVIKTITSTEVQGCSIKLNSDLPSPREQPLYLKKYKSKIGVALPTVEDKEGKIVLKSNEKIILSCPGINNFLTVNHQNSSEFLCVRNTTLGLPNSGKSFDIKNGVCAKPVHAILRPFSKKCADGKGKLYQIGFKSEGWQTEVIVCHDISNSNTLYTVHEVTPAIQGSEKDNLRPKFADGGLKDLYIGFEPDECYLQNSQQRLFERIFGRKESKNYFNKAKGLYLSRGHLAPHADFIYGTEQHATYFYINVAPQWQIINNGNWLIVERMVRNQAIMMKKELIVVTGTYGILELTNKKEEKRQLFLNNEQKKIPVPQYFWKIIFEPEFGEGIAFLTSNNPFLKSIPNHFCSNDCEEFGWTSYNSAEKFQNPSKGLTSCCSVEDFHKLIPSISFLKVKKIMKGIPNGLEKSNRSKKKNN